MSIVDDAQKWFPAAVRKRGEPYVTNGLVRITGTADNEVCATVRGTSDYNVRLRLRKTALVTRCDCPIGDDWELCKHVWAVINAAAASNLLRGRVTEVTVAEAKNEFRLRREDLLHGDDDDEDYEEEDDEDDGFFDDDPDDRRLDWNARLQPPAPFPPLRREPPWMSELRKIAGAPLPPRVTEPIPPGEIVYLADVAGGRLQISVKRRPLRKDGTPGKPVSARIDAETLRSLPPDEQELIAMLSPSSHTFWESEIRIDSAAVPAAAAEHLLRRLSRTGRLLAEHFGSIREAVWSDATLRLQASVVPSADESSWIIQTSLEASKDLEDVDPRDIALLQSGIAYAEGRFFRYEPADENAFARRAFRQRFQPIPASATADLRRALMNSADESLEVPDELAWTEVRVAPRPSLAIKHDGRRNTDTATISFDYEDVTVGDDDRRPRIILDDRVVVRDEAAERRAMQIVAAHSRKGSTSSPFTLKGKEVLALISTAARLGWKVTASGRRIRSGGRVSASVSSGIDWFDMSGGVDFEGVHVSLAGILASLKKGERQIVLADGTVGVLPDEVVERYARLAQIASIEGDQVRFRSSQLLLIDAMLEELPEIGIDETFGQAREKLSEITQPEPLDPPPGFQGVLRPYQKASLGWMAHLRELGFGGCLADDMGLGKTVQVLAMLEQRREDGVGLPSLAIVPRSLIFNWKEEAARFTPELRVVDYSGSVRDLGVIPGAHLVLTTYGTLRRDIKELSRTQFDYVILDEAQAIKNAGSQSAKATLLLRANHRLALSGTPIENHLGELGSLFSFLNPGMLTRASMAAQNVDEEARKLIARGVRPFILRRTKKQVESDLPDRIEQTIVCEMEPEQRELYDSVRDEYRQSLQKRIRDVGFAKAKIHVLEALLRLRQIACDPRLVDSEVRSAKMDALFPLLEEILEEKHKVLIFSQFTSLLALVRRDLAVRGIDHLYLDGKTRDRQSLVHEFQNGDVPLFLISLKAGGVGLNLTAAEYVILLDPWWNPAVEAQAIDRAHRIGQTQRVIAYRLVTKDTVEEKILELQQSKRELAEAILTEDNSVVRKLTMEDLDLLMR